MEGLQDGNDQCAGSQSLGLEVPLCDHRCRGYVYDQETGLYYLNSRCYDPETGRFVNADGITYIGKNGTILSYNLYSYCKNNPVMGYDPTGHFGLVASIIITGAIVGGILGAFNAAVTGGNIIESAIEGCITGTISAACGMLIGNPIEGVIIATVLGGAADLGVQATTQYIEDGSVDLDIGRIVKTALQTGIGTAIPAFKNAELDVVDAIGTAVLWAEGSALITCADVVVTKAIVEPYYAAKKPGTVVKQVTIHGPKRAYG